MNPHLAQWGDPHHPEISSACSYPEYDERWPQRQRDTVTFESITTHPKLMRYRKVVLSLLQEFLTAFPQAPNRQQRPPDHTSASCTHTPDERTMPPKLKIAIAGGGLAGLSAAVALASSGHSVTVCEAASKLEEVLHPAARQRPLLGRPLTYPRSALASRSLPTRANTSSAGASNPT